MIKLNFTIEVKILSKISIESITLERLHMQMNRNESTRERERENKLEKKTPLSNCSIGNRKDMSVVIGRSE